MANKKIIVSDGNGKYREAPSSSFSVDDGILTASAVIMQTGSWAAQSIGTPVSGILQSFNGKLTNIPPSSSLWQSYDKNNDSILSESFSIDNLSGTLFQYRSDYGGFGPHRIASASFNGDLFGSLSSSWPVKVISVANVTGGVLDSRFGGTGTGSFENGAIVTLSGSGFKPSYGANNVIATDINRNWNLANKTSIEPTNTYLTGVVAFLYTGSVNGTTTATWIKPGSPGSPFPDTPRFIRVICQGGGGGGGGGSNKAGSTPRPGNGGCGGGYSDITYNAENINNSVIVTAGSGGAGASGTSLTNGPYGPAQSGGGSSFGNYIISGGGAGGWTASATGNAAQNGGIGYLFNGGDVAAVRGNTGVSVVVGGASGGGGGDYNSAGRRGGDITRYNLLATAAPAAGTGGTTATSDSINPFNVKTAFDKDGNLINIPKLACAGGTGGCGSNTVPAGTGNGALATFGSGGGGGGVNGIDLGRTGGNGGNGGVGYVLIICT